MEHIYDRLAPVYDVIYGATLNHGRRQAMARLAPAAGESILEIGVGTGLSALNYPRSCRVVAIDLSWHMLLRARRRFGRRRLRHVALCRMDAQQLGFPDRSFDAVYAPYVLNVMPDPVRMAREMARVCRPDGRIVLLNHFARARRLASPVDELLGRIASRAGGAKWDVNLDAFLSASGLTPRSIDHVNLARVSSVVVCTVKDRSR